LAGMTALFESDFFFCLHRVAIYLLWRYLWMPEYNVACFDHRLSESSSAAERTWGVSAAVRVCSAIAAAPRPVFATAGKSSSVWMTSC
jgi:hypothetical protein